MISRLETVKLWTESSYLTLQSNLSVDLPINLFLYENDVFRLI